ncbi:MAG: response regulator, partial [Oligoflexia bacterium]
MSAKKLLVADDSLTIQKVIRLAMSHEGYEIQAVSEGNEAIEQILLFRPKIVLIDVSLPGKSAIEVKAAIDAKPELAGTQFVLMSSAFETIDEAAIDRARFAARLTKPFDPAHLRKLVSDAFGEPSPAPSIVPPLAPPPFAPPPPLPPLSSSDDSDIRQLTQSTLKMAGLDDLEWSVN